MWLLAAMRREREVFMGKLDTMTKEYMSEPGHFADAFNYFLFDGKKRIREADLTALDPTEMGAVFDNGSKEIVQKVRDLLKHVNDYKLNLIVPREIEDFSKFSSDFGKVLHYIAVSGSKEGLKQLATDPAFQKVGNDSVRLINECTNSNIPIDEEREETNMCKGLLEWKEEERMEGRMEGRTEIIAQMYHEGDITLQKACELLHCSEEEFLDRVNQYRE